MSVIVNKQHLLKTIIALLVVGLGMLWIIADSIETQH